MDYLKITIRRKGKDETITLTPENTPNFLEVVQHLTELARKEKEDGQKKTTTRQTNSRP